MVDRAAINAFLQQFPQSTVHGCFFHLSQCIWRQIQQAGLQVRYSQDAEFALQLPLLPALAFVPPNDVVDAFEQLLDSQFCVENENVLLLVLNYFEDTRLGRLDRRRRRRSHMVILLICGMCMNWWKKKKYHGDQNIISTLLKCALNGSCVIKHIIHFRNIMINIQGGPDITCQKKSSNR
jgi:hypothetical protein